MLLNANLFSQNIFDDYDVIHQYREFLPPNTGGGGGGVAIKIENDILTIRFGAGFDPSELKIGPIVPILSKPLIPRVGLGQINTGATGDQQYTASINLDGWLSVYRSHSPPNPVVTFFNTTFELDLKEHYCNSIEVQTPEFIMSSNHCGDKLLSKSGAIPQGHTWYWQGTNPNGVNQAPANDAEYNDYVVSTTGTYYLRALSHHGCWSDPVGKNVVVNPVPADPPSIVSLKNDCHGIWFSRDSNPGSGVSWHWKKSPLPGASSLGTGAVLAMDKVDFNQVYLVAESNGAGCQSLNYSTLSFTPSPSLVSTVLTAPMNYVREETVMIQAKGESSLDQYCSEKKMTRFTYYDALGREAQYVFQGNSPGGFDLVNGFEYDDFSRVSKEYLTFGSTSSDGAYKANANNELLNFFNITGNVAHDEEPYKVNVYESSPLSRLKESGNYGTTWQPISGQNTVPDMSLNYPWHHFVDEPGGGSVFIDVLNGNLSVRFSGGFNEAPLYLGNIVYISNRLPDLVLGRLNVGNYLVSIVNGYLNISGSSERITGFDKDFYVANISEQGATVSYDYETNGPGDRVMSFNVSSSGILTLDSFHPTAKLFKNVKEDESGNHTLNYIDEHGRVILKREQALVHINIFNHRLNEWAETYYVYDDFGNLRYVIPPAAVIAIGTPSIPHTIDLTLLDQWVFRYDYDSRRRMIKKKVPGADTVYMIYDSRDRLVLTQDGEQRTDNEWLFTKYDAFNRPVLTGIHNTTAALNQQEMQVVVDAHYSKPTSSFYETLTGNVHGYTNASYPVQDDENRYLSVTYYDDYGFQGTVPGFGSTFNYQAPTVPPNCQTIPQGTYCYEVGAFDRVKGQVTGTKTRVLGTDQWSYTVTHYDDRYRVIQTVEVNEYQNSRERTSNLYSFNGWLLETYRDHTKDLQSHGLLNRYEYDHAGRLLKAYHEVFDGGSGQGEVLLSQHHYNELGELVTKKLHKFGQSAAYVQADPLVGQANVHYDGQIVSGNYQGERAYIATGSVRLTPGFRVAPGTEFTARIGYSQQDAKIFNNQIEEYFAQEIDYRYNIRGWLTHINEASLTGSLGDTNQPKDYWGMELGYNNALTGVTATPAYNGNISAVKWSDDLGQRTRAYAYAYDPMNRITDADHSIVGQANTAAFDVAIRDGMNPGYDLNGNILKLSRGGVAGAGMDILTYDYGTGNTRGNQLLSVTDAGDDTEGFKDGNRTGADYRYDDNGNMTQDLNKDINAITYNHLNLPETVTKADGSYIKYIYDAAGVKLTQEIYDASNALTKKTDYLDGFIYENDELQLIQHEEGRIVPDATTGNYEYEYYLKDHLGNNRVVFTTNPKTIDFTLNYESSASNPDDEAVFSDLDNIIEANVHDHTDAGSLYQRSQRLTGTADAAIGSVLTIPVGAGDRISASVYAKYLAPTATNNPGVAIGALLAAAISGGTGGTTYEGAINSSYGPSGSIITNLLSSQIDPARPMAFLNLLFLPGEGASSIDPGQFTFKQISPSSSNAHALLTLDEPFEAPGAGHVVVYLSNESEVLTEVYFDDLVIMVNEHPVVQTADYYPGGLTFNSFNRITAKENRYKYNGKELQEETGWYHYGVRYYDPELFRWMSPDPLADEFYSWSPYTYSFNNPVLFVDPDGAAPLSANCCGLPGYSFAVQKIGSKVIEAISTANARAGAMNRAHARLTGEDPGFLTRAGHTFTSYFHSFGGYTDAEDVSVLTQGRTVAGKDATLLDYTLAGAGMFLPMVSGGSLKNGIKNLIPTEPGMQSAKKVSEMAEQIKSINSTDEFIELFKNADSPIEVIEHEGKFFIHNGHHRVEAAIEAGVKFDVPVEVISIDHSRFSSIEEMLEAANDILE